MATIKAGKVTFTEEASEAKFGYVKGEAKWAELLTPGLYGTYGIKLYGDEVVEMKEELEALRDSAYDEVIELGKKANKADVLKQDDEGNYFVGFNLKRLSLMVHLIRLLCMMQAETKLLTGIS